MADDITHYDAIEGYCDRLSVVAGETIGLCASSTVGRYSVTVSRAGVERETVWSTAIDTGAEQLTPDDADALGCGWSVSVEIPTGSSWPSGFYLVQMTTDDPSVEPARRTAHAGFVVRAPQPSARILFVLATNTWNAYNDWGGRSLYTGGHRVSFQRPFGRGMLVRQRAGDDERDDRKSRPRRPGEQPDVDGATYQRYRHEHGFPGYMGSAGWFTYDRRFVEWAEGAGYDLDYAISSDLAALDGGGDGMLTGYDLVVGAGHDEYWSAEQRNVVEEFVAGGGNYASFSGNTMFWQVRLDGHDMVCHKYRAHLDDPVVATDPSRMSGMWADPVVGRPESRFLGGGSMYGLYSRFGQATPRGAGGFVVYRDDHWMLDGSGLRYGDVLGADDGVVGYETVGTHLTFDDVNLPVIVPGDTLPGDVEIVAFTPSSNLAMGEYPASIAALDDQGDLEFIAERVYGGGDKAMARARHGNAVMLCCRPFGDDGGQVVTVGSTDWVFGLADDPQVARVTANVIERLG